MGVLRKAWDWFTLSALGASTTFASEPEPRPLAQVLLDMAGAGLLPRAGRPEALSVPAVQRGRNLICSISTLPLIQYGPDLVVVRLPLLEQIDPDVPNVVTLAQTVEDLLFEGISWWRITAFGADGFPTSARHLDYSSVSLQPPGGRSPAPLPGGYDPRDAVIYYDGDPIPASQVIRFDSPNPGLLHAAGRAVRRAVLLDQTSALYADNPRPLDYFTPADGADPADDDEVAEILADWNRARKARSTAYVPAALKYNSVDTPTPADLQLVDLQRKATLDIANAIGLDPEDLGISTTSRTYQNGVDRRQDRINDVLSPYMKAITDRLSMRDVTKRGYKVLFDLDDYLKPDPKTRAEVAVAYIGAGVWAPSEARTKERMPAMTAAQRAEVAPVPAAPPARQPGSNVVPIRAAMGFSAEAPLHLTFDTTFTVDTERRVIEGIAVPYGPTKVAMKNGRKWRFQQGSLVPSGDISRNKLLRDHDFSQPQGPLDFHDDRPDGMFVRYKIGHGLDGDRTLAEAQEKVRDGLSVGVDIISAQPDPLNRGAFLVDVGGAFWYETSVLAVPAFDDARVTRVAARRDNGETMETCATCGATLTAGVTHTCEPTTPPTNQPASPPAPLTQLTLTAEQQQALLAAPGVLQALVTQRQQPPTPAVPEGSLVFSPDQVTALVNSGALGTLLGVPRLTPAPQNEPGEQRQVVNPVRPGPAQVREELPYRFDREGNLTRGSKFDFSTDLVSGSRGDGEALERAEKFVRAQFADVDQADAAALNPNRQRPDLYVDQKDFSYPIWDSINKGTIPDATPFVLPKFSSSSGLVAAHTEGVEPTGGTVAATAQTITPSPVSGKVPITREAWDQGGNPQLSGIIWRQMLRAWYEALEASAVTLLEGLAPSTITLTLASQDDVLVGDLEAALAVLQYARGGLRMRDFFLQVDLYKKLVAAVDAQGRKLLPILGPVNANGQTSEFYADLSIGGLRGRPAWATAASAPTATNSFLFDRNDVSGWATAPQRLEFNFEVRYVHVAIWGYKATACTDLTGVRKVSYGPGA